MPKRDQLFSDVQSENGQIVLLAAQASSIPSELQLVVETAEIDPGGKALRPLHNYIIRVLGALEYRIVKFGATVADIQLIEEHPLLYSYNSHATALFFRGEADDVNELVLDIAQAHAVTFQLWRHFPEYLNVQQPLATLFKSGGGIVGHMPEQLAESIAKVLEKHGLETKIMKDKPYTELHNNPVLLQQRPKVLLIGDSYFISYSFSVEEMGKS